MIFITKVKLGELTQKQWRRSSKTSSSTSGTYTRFMSQETQDIEKHAPTYLIKALKLDELFHSIDYENLIVIVNGYDVSNVQPSLYVNCLRLALTSSR